jgi:hypothetical protein
MKEAFEVHLLVIPRDGCFFSKPQLLAVGNHLLIGVLRSCVSDCILT